MLDLRYVVDHLDEVRASLSRRGTAAVAALDRIADIASRRARVIRELEGLRAKKNEANQAMAQLDKKSAAFQAQREQLKGIAAEAKQLEQAQRELEAELEPHLLSLPNLPADTTPDGPDESANVELRRWGTKPAHDFEPKDHVALGTRLDIVDFDRAAKVSGARFAFLKGAGARLERALMAFMLDLHAAAHGYREIWPPSLVTDETMTGTGQLPKFEQDLFRIASDWDVHGEAKGRELYLIPTSEVPLVAMHTQEILDADQLPLAYTAFSPCYRSEAGSHGKDTRGLVRLHLFDKVELVRFETPERGLEALEALTGHAEAVLQKLGLPYRVVELCTGDLGFHARKTYDLEVWLPGQQKFREISSCSWCDDFQARRCRIRYRPAPKEKPRLVHTLNGSGLAIGRTLIAVLENYQQADGTVRVPEVLVPYMGGMTEIRPA